MIPQPLVFQRVESKEMTQPIPSNEWSIAHAAHLLNRAAFGGTPKQIAGLHAMGPQKAISFLLSPTQAPNPPEWATNVEPTKELTDALRVARRNRKEDPDAHRKLQRQLYRRRAELQLWWLNVICTTPSPATEKLTLFWHGHFATSMQKVGNPWLHYLQNSTFRDQALGSFSDLVVAMGRDPAMILWLDLQQSRREAPNENYARELMELFTLGEGNYTEADIRESARAFTGHRTNPSTGGFSFIRAQHDRGDKTFFGKTGALDDKAVVEILFNQAAAAEFLTTKLWRFYASEEAPPAVVKSLAEHFRKSGYNTRALLAKMFESQAFYAPEVLGSQIKGPVQWLAQLCRQLECQPPPKRVPQLVTRALGQALFLPPSVKGWDGGRAWISTHTLKLRIGYANEWIENGSKDGIVIDWKSIVPDEERKSADAVFASVSTRLLSAPLPEADRAKIIETVATIPSGSDDAVKAAVLGIVSHPVYQLT